MLLAKLKLTWWGDSYFEVMTLRLGDIMAGAAEFPNITCVERKETRLLRNAREVVATIGLEGAYSYICSQVK